MRLPMLQRILFSLVIFLLSSYLPVQAQTRGSAINPYEHGVKRFQKGDLDGAIEDFTKAISLSSRFGSNQLTRSSVPHSAKGLAPSAGEAREITVIDPLTAKAYTSRGAAR